MRVFFCAVVLGIAQAHPALFKEASNNLHPVQNLYVKPSLDGSTGDLYVAASEDNGVQTQWLTDQPINFLSSLSQPLQASALPLAYSTTLGAAASPLDESLINTQKRSIINQPLQYAYASSMPLIGKDIMSNSLTYGIPSAPAATPTQSTTQSNSEKPCSESLPANMVQPMSPYMPLQYLYPSFMNAATTALNAFRESGINDEVITNAMIPQSHYPFWSSAAYGYPSVQYVMVDPSAWAASQSTTSNPTINNIPVVENKKA